MPVTVSYPGVYINEVPSSVHTITGVPTSVAAFVGYAPMGPVNSPEHISSWSAYERTFGGLDPSVEMSYAVYSFFVNGGSSAEIVRAGGRDGNKGAEAFIDVDTKFTLKATSVGEWANSYVASVKKKDHVAGQPDSFDLIIQRVDKDGGLATVEDYSQLTAGGVTSALRESRYFNVSGDDPKTVPDTGIYGQADMLKLIDKADGDDEPPADPNNPPPANPANQPAQNASKKGKDLASDLPHLDIVAGVTALDAANIFNILCLPKPAGTDHSAEDLGEILRICELKRAMLILDPPTSWGADLDFKGASTNFPTRNNHAAIYFPNILTKNQQTGALDPHGPCGAVAGVWAATDAARGVWKAPAGTNATLSGFTDLAAKVDDAQNGELNPIGVNCLRSIPLAGPVIWGARTCQGADVLTSEWKYVPIRRTALFIEESLRRGTQWIVFEPNDEPLWAAIRLNVGAFMNSLFRQGAFQGTTPREAYFVKCDKENNPQNDIDRGIVNINVGFAPLKPAEFVIIHIEQLAGQLQV